MFNIQRFTVLRMVEYRRCEKLEVVYKVDIGYGMAVERAIKRAI